MPGQVRARKHSGERVLAGGADLDADVEAALQQVLRRRAEAETPRPWGASVLSELFCCAHRKDHAPRTAWRRGGPR